MWIRAGYKKGIEWMNEISFLDNLKKQISKKNVFVKLILVLCIPFFAEFFVFNYHHWITLFVQPIIEYQVEQGEGLQDNGNGTWTVIGENSYFEYTNINSDLSTLYVNVKVLNRDNSNSIPLHFSVKDESHQNYYWIPDRNIWETVEKSHFMTFHLYGECKALKMTVALSKGDIFSISTKMNEVIPFSFSFTRWLLISIFMICFFVFRPSSNLFRIKYRKIRIVGKGFITGFVLLHILLFWNLVNMNEQFQVPSWGHHMQYQELAEAMAQGQVSLLAEPPEELSGMENPYDYEARALVMENAKPDEQWSIQWDHCFYNGKYYVYFGVVPVVLLYLPYYCITGQHISNYVVVFLFSVVLLLAIMGVISQIIRKWFPKTPFLSYLLLNELVVISCGLIYMCKRPDFYTIPIIAGLAFGMSGLYLWLSSEKLEIVDGKRLALGSLCMALVAGCRPQLFLFSFFSFIIFGKYIKTTCLFSKKEIKNLFFFFTPFIIVGILLMYYNYIRFGSPFDFGANYNLTFNDMRKRGWVFDRTWLGLVAYLIGPMRIQTEFPFVQAISYDTQYMGVTIQEITFGGLFSTNLFVWLGMIPIFHHKRFRKDVPWKTCVFCFFCAFGIVIADTQMSGLLLRYFSDFTIFFLIAAVFAYLIMDKNMKSKKERKLIRGFLFGSLLTGICYQGMIFFLDTGEALKDVNPEMFAKFKYMIAFWL